MESLGLPPAVMRQRVEETLDLLGLADLRDRPLRTLSGGQRQRVAIGSVLTTHPRVARARRADVGARPGRGRGGARRAAATGARPRASPSCSPSTGSSASCSTPTASCGSPATAGCVSGDPSRRPGRLAGRSPGRRARPARRLGPAPAVGARRAPPRGTAREPGCERRRRRTGRPSRRRRPAPDAVRAELRGVTVRHGSKAALRGVDLALRSGEVVARDGAQRRRASRRCSATLVGLRDARRRHASASAAPRRTRSAPHDLLRRVGLVPQEAADLLLGRDGAPGVRRRPTTTRAPDRARPRAPRRPRARGSTRRPTRATCPRVSASRSRCRSSSPPTPRRCCSTSRPAASTTRPSGGSSRCSAAAPPPARPSSLATHDVELVAEVADRRRGPRRRRGRRRRPDRRRRRLLARVRPAGRQDPGAAAPGSRSPRSRPRCRRRDDHRHRRAPSGSGPGPRSPLALVSHGRGRGVRLAAARRPGLRPRALRRRAAGLRAAPPAAARRRSSPRSPTAASTRRPSRCSACWPLSAPRCDRSAAGSPASRPVFVLIILGGRVLGRGFGFVLGARHAVRVRAAHRRRRAVAAVPDARRRVGRLRRRLPAAGARAPRGLARRRRTARSPASPTASCSTCGSGRSPAASPSGLSFVAGAPLPRTWSTSSRSASRRRSASTSPGPSGRRPRARRRRPAACARCAGRSRRAAFEAPVEFVHRPTDVPTPVVG